MPVSEANMPLSHRSQEARPSFGCCLPASHGEHTSRPPDEKWPSEHFCCPIRFQAPPPLMITAEWPASTRVHRVAPSAAWVPLVQGTGAAAAFAQLKPASQMVQLAEPSCGATQPLEQASQDGWPCFGWLLPASQTVHSTSPPTDAFPAGHFEQEVWPTAKCPALHGCGGASEVRHLLPGGHGVHMFASASKL